MICRRLPQQRPIGTRAVVYPDSGISTPPNVGDFFCGRVFDRDGSGVEDDFDFHRGVDMPGSIGVPAYTPVGGAKLRFYQGHYFFRTDGQVQDWPLISGTGGILSIVTPNVGPARASNDGAHQWQLIYPRIANDDWVFDFAVPTGASWDAAGRTIAGLRFEPLTSYHPGSTEFVQIRYDGTILFVDAEDSLAVMKSAIFAVAGAKWLRIEYVGGTVFWRTATNENGSNFVLRDSMVATFTGFGNGATWGLGLLAEIQAGATPNTIDIEFAGGADGSTIPRFGNWMRFATGYETWSVLHLEFLDSDIISLPVVEAGRYGGNAGRTGLDFTSGASGGRVRTLHFHSEIQNGTSYTHDSDLSLNPLGAGRYPRPDSTNVVSLAQVTENDPNGNPSVNVIVTIDRNPDGTVAAFDRLVYTGTLGTHTIDYEQRLGIDPVDPDNPDFEDVYQVPEPFNSADADYVCNYYHLIATYGTFVSVVVLDTQGNVLASL